MQRVPQPPVNPALRAGEAHTFWPAFIVVVIGAVLLAAGVRRVTGLETAKGGTATELQLSKAFSSGGLQYASHLPPPPPPKLDDPAASAEALERWSRQSAKAAAPKWKVRVDTGATTPCPT